GRRLWHQRRPNHLWRVRAGRGTGGNRRSHRGRPAQPPSGSGRRHPAVRARRGDHRRVGEHQRGRRRERADRSDRRHLSGVVPRVLVLHDLRSHGLGAGAPTDRTLRAEGMTGALGTKAGRFKLLGLVVAIAAGWSVPYVFSNYQVSLTTLILISAMLATSINFMAGN